MPYIRCDLQAGVSDEQKARLADAFARITHEKIGSPTPYIHVAINEIPGPLFVESGERDRVHDGLKKTRSA